MQGWYAGMLAAVLTLGMAPAAQAQAPYAGSARVTPVLVSAHMQLALNQLRQAESTLEAEGTRETLRLDLRPVRQALADAADELTLARMATADPDQIAAIDRMLAEIDAVRDRLDRRALEAGTAMRRLEREMLALHQTARSQIAMREEAVNPEGTQRPAVR